MDYIDDLIDDKYYLVGPVVMTWPDCADILKRRILGGPFPDTQTAELYRNEHKELFERTSSWWETGAQMKLKFQWTLDYRAGRNRNAIQAGDEVEIVTPPRSAQTQEIVTSESGERFCSCGCGRQVIGNAKRKFASDACKMRYSRAIRRSNK